MDKNNIPKTAAERRRKADQAQRDRGLVRKCVWLQPKYLGELKKLQDNSKQDSVVEDRKG